MLSEAPMVVLVILVSNPEGLEIVDFLGGDSPLFRETIQS